MVGGRDIVLDTIEYASARYRHVVFVSPAPQERSRRDALATAIVPDDVPPGELAAGEIRLLSMLMSRAGLRVSDYRPETLRRRARACVTALRAGSAADAADRLRVEPRLARSLVGSVVLGVTGFFRDPGVWAFVDREVVPELAAEAARRRGPGGGGEGLRVWSAACAEGQELYTLAVMLAERGLLSGPPVTLLGSDCRVDAVATAARGRYDAGVLRQVPAHLHKRWFRTDFGSGRVEVAPAIRAACHWRTANVLTVREPGAWDLISCRNMAMYLRPEAASRLWGYLERALRPGGVLVVGKAERPLGGRGLVEIGPGVYRRRLG